jgi:hypothetical protein
MNISNLELFTSFIKGDRRCSPQFKLEQKKGKSPVKSLDFPLYRYAISLKSRVQILSMLKEEVLCQNKMAMDEYEESQKIGMGTSYESLKLVIYYESFLNQIYNIMENISRINLIMFDDNKNKPPNKFSDQVKQIKKGNLKLHPDYDKLIKEKIEWYDKVNLIRNNANHFLAGFVVFGRSEEGKTIPEYLNYNLSEREKHSCEELEIKTNILESTDSFYTSILIFLNCVAKIYIEKMDKDVGCAISLIIDNSLEIRKISYNEFISGGMGTKLFPSME